MATTENLPNRQTTTYQVTRTTVHMTGLVPMPGAGPEGTPVVFGRIHQPWEMEVVNVLATCEYGSPVIPSPIDPNSPMGLNPNRIFLGMTIGLVVPIIIGGAPGHIQSVSAQYRYAKIQAEGPVCNYPTGKNPWEPQDVTDNYFPKENFSTGVIDPTFPTPKFPLPTDLPSPLGP